MLQFVKVANYNNNNYHMQTVISAAEWRSQRRKWQKKLKLAILSTHIELDRTVNVLWHEACEGSSTHDGHSSKNKKERSKELKWSTKIIKNAVKRPNKRAYLYIYE